MVQAHVVPQAALASPWLRLGATLLNSILLVVTLGIGYLVWTMVLWNQGSDPGKKICGLRMVKADTGRTCTFGDMLVRNVVMGALVLSIIGTFTVGIGYLVDAFMIFGDRRQRLIDKMSGTLVVQDQGPRRADPVDDVVRHHTEDVERACARATRRTGERPAAADQGTAGGLLDAVPRRARPAGAVRVLRVLRGLAEPAATLPTPRRTGATLPSTGRARLHGPVR